MKRNAGLDIIRGVAILQVFVWHFLGPIIWRHIPFAQQALSLTWTGVDLFFVLSGFLIGGILLRNVNAENFFGVFYARRALRILPLYLLALAFYFVLYPATVDAKYLLLVQNFTWAAHSMYGPDDLAPTWSLAVEEQFYLILPALIMFARPRRLPWVCIALILCAPIYRIGCILAGYPFAGYLLLPGRMDDLFFGVLLAWAHSAGFAARAAEIARWAIVPLGLVFIALAMVNRGPLDPVMQAGGYSIVAAFYASALAILSSFGWGQQWYWRPLAWAGVGAFSIYLSHVYFGHLAYRLFGPSPLALAAMVSATCFAALLSWKLIEAPLIKLSHARFKYRTAEPRPTVREVAEA